MGLYVFQLEKEGEYHTLDINDAKALEDVESKIARYASEITQKPVKPGSVNWYIAKADTPMTALEEAIENGYRFCSPETVQAFQQKISNFMLVVNRLARPGVQN